MLRAGMLVAAAAAFMLSAPGAGAQAVAPAAPVPGGPTMLSASLAPRLDLRNETTGATSARYTLDNGSKLMIIGGVALLTGAIIGDTPGTIIMVGGAAVGLYGLYVHLNRPHGTAEVGYSRSF